MRKLKDIETTEVSLVDVPANDEQFLFFKRKQDGKDIAVAKADLSITIESDGTFNGTKILVNGDEVDRLQSFYFSMYKPEDGSTNSRAISCSYSKEVKAEDGFSHTESYYLSKGSIQMDKELKELLQKCVGADVEVTFKKGYDKDVEAKTFQEALTTITKYQEDFPTDLTAAISLASKYAGYGFVALQKDGEKKPETTETDDNTGNSESDADNENVEKAGAKFSQKTTKALQAIVTAVGALESLMSPGKKDKTEKSAESSEAVNQTLADITKQLETLGKSQADDATTELLKGIQKSVDTLAGRVKVVEETAGVKKGVTGQDDDNEAEAGDTKDAGKKWPSLSDRK